VAAESIAPPLVAGGLIIETMFAWPGVARVFYASFSQFDLGALVGVVLLYAVAFVLIKTGAGLVRDAQGGVLFDAGAVQPSAVRRPGFSANGIVGLGVLSVAAFGALAAGVAPWGPYLIDQAHWVGYPLAPGIAGHVLGTEENGRDLLARLLLAVRTSLTLAAFAAVVALVIGAVVALVMRAVPSSYDRRVLDVTAIRPFAALPFIFVALTVLFARFGKVTLHEITFVVILGVVSAPAIVPVFRAAFAARRYSAILAGAVDIMGGALLLEITLSAHGFGVQAPTASLGNMLANMLANMTVAPWAVAAPMLTGIALLFALFAIGDDLRERAWVPCGGTGRRRAGVPPSPESLTT
jgi:ABC-type dipeptide/oligopeptide/nickel transport system permease subunit